MSDYCEPFRGKKITVMGLGLLGRGVGDVKFLAQCGAKLIVTDLKSKDELKSSIKKLKRFPNIKYRLGGHRLEDFRNKDFILKSSDIPLNSPFIAEARKNKVPVKMSTALFAKLAGIPIIGITGTRGKSTTTHLIDHILRNSGYRVHLGGNVRGISTLALLPKVRSGDLAVLELDSWQLQGFDDFKISPHIAVFTNFMPDHMKYYNNDMSRYFADKASIFRFQNKNDFTIAGKEIAARIKTKGRKIIPRPLPASWPLHLPGAHNRENAALAVAAVKALGLKDEEIKKRLATFTGLLGRLELLRTMRGIEIYNDTTATTPDATRIGLQAFPDKKKKIVLIMGGSDKKLDMTNLLEIIPQFVKRVVLLSGTGTDTLPKSFKKICIRVDSLHDAINEAFKIARPGEIILLSPAFASFGMFKNEFDRGEKFKKLIKRLK